MDFVETTSDFQEWELLQANSDTEAAPVNSPDSNDSIDGIGGGGLIQANYFSLEPQNRGGEGLDDDKSAESDNPSWIDPGLGENPTRYVNEDSGKFWSDSSSERSEDRKFSELERVHELGFSETEKKELKFEGIGEILEEKGQEEEDLEKLRVESSGIDAENTQLDVEGNRDLRVGSEVLDDEKSKISKIASGGDDSGDKKSGEAEKRSVVWWKMPVEFLKYCVFRMSPVWTVSAAAAVMGLMILGRRLYKMKKKSRGLQIKVTVDDKKASQVMSRAARLNEAFSVVKRVPMIRPSLPAVGSTSTWPVMSLRQA